MKKIFLVCLVAIIVVSCSKKTEQLTEAQILTPDAILQSEAQINEFIKTKTQANGHFDWSDAPDEVIWSALLQSDKIASVGYKPASENNIDARIHTIDITSVEWQAAKQKVLQIIFEEESKTNTALKIDKQEIWEETVLPVVDVIINNFSTIKKLRASNLIRYVEPMGYEPIENDMSNNKGLSSSGCGNNVGDNTLINNTHYQTITPNTKVSWNYAAHGVQNAWAKSTGSGTKVFIIDTGVEFDQENLGSAFNQGNSSGRTIERIVTLPRSTFFGIPTGPTETPDDNCGHGTSMAGACAAPRGTDGNACGIAYNCNLVTCRASTDVLIDASREAKGVADAYVNAANRADVKIISMSLGRITSSGQIADAIRYTNGKGKLMFCAGGTSFSWSASWYGVIFPAWMPEVQAVTGVKQNTNFNNCNDCHKGSEIDFVVVMERIGDDMHALTLADRGDIPSTVGGSSVATASLAGMAALVWSKYPTYTTTQILNKLITNSSRYPNKNNEYGWGLVNVDGATSN
jgi:subtilisin family serine protease